jgi:Predicted membrane protein
MANERFKTKLSKKQRRKNIQVFTVVAICLYIFTLLFCRYVIEVFDGWPTLEIYVIVATLVFTLCTLTLTPVVITGVILGYQKGKAKRICDDSTFVSLQNIEYYRDNLGKLEPAVVSLLVDLDIYGEKDIVATLLKMKNKGAIAFDESGAIFLTGKNKSKLARTERELLYRIVAGKYSNKKLRMLWRLDCFREAERLGYIKKKGIISASVDLKGMAMGLLCFLAAMFLWGTYLASDVWHKIGPPGWTIVIFGWVLLIAVFLFTPFYLLDRARGYKKRGDVLWERTELGDEMAGKVAGLAHYIHDFTLLSEKEKEEATLWEDYLVYAVVLEENDKIVKDISKSYKVDLDKVGKRKIRYAKH